MLRPTFFILLLLVLLPCAGCVGPEGRAITAAEYADMEREAGQASRSAAMQVDRAAVDDQVALAERADGLHREGLELAFDQAELMQKRERLALSESAGQIARELTLAQARERLTTARAERLFFTEVERSLLLGQDALSLLSAENSLLEMREELAQLELMYGSDPADATAEIVVARTRRRVARSEERLRLAGMSSRKLKEIDLPKRMHDGALALQDAEAAVASAENAIALGVIDRESAERGLDHEAALLELAAKALKRREQRLEEDQRSWERGESGGLGSG